MFDREYVNQCIEDLKYDELYDDIMSYVEKEDIEAIYQLGYLYYYGIGVEEDMQEAFHYLDIAAKKNHKEAKELLGKHFLETADIILDLALETKIESDEDVLKVAKYYGFAIRNYKLSKKYGNVEAINKLKQLENNLR